MELIPNNPAQRPRRLRGSAALRRAVRETHISPDSFILPLYIDERGGKEEISSLPGQFRYGPDRVAEEVEAALADGVNSFLLFGIPAQKDEVGSGAWAEQGAVQTALGGLKKAYPEALFITDVCMCEYTSHGHCGALRGQEVDNDATLELLAKTALSHARAGADVVAPSDMMDGRVAAIRAKLDAEGFAHIPIMSYAVKYASAFYGPFRVAVDSAPAFGDRRGYQMDCHNRREALKEAALDIAEGADLLIVKPALSYLDIIAQVSAASDRPVVGYSVSGEYAMVKAAAMQGWVDEGAIMRESAVAVFRAGAGLMVSHYARPLALAAQKGDIG